jgi:hypothetical protein
VRSTRGQTLGKQAVSPVIGMQHAL